jgi:predicted transposase/invertase (TIGR01784 family)
LDKNLLSFRLSEQKGMQLGKQEAQQEIAKELLKSGIDSSIIAAATHLTVDKIKALLVFKWAIR